MTLQRFRLLASRAALAACLSVGVIACGDDDDDDETGAGTEDGGGGEQAAGGDACDAIVEFNATVMDVDTEGASEDEMASLGEELGALWAPVDENAPDEVSDEAGEITEALSDLAAGDPEMFDSDEIFETYTTVLGATVAGCGLETVSARAVDYAFEDLPETVPAGTVAIELENASETGEMHEMVLFKKAEGETRSAEEIMDDPASEEEGPGEFAGATFAPPGVTSTGLAELTAGDYIAVCFIPVGSGDVSEEDAEEGEGGPPHFTQGMLAELTVE